MAKSFLDYNGLGVFTSFIKSLISKKTVDNTVTTGGTGSAYTATVDGITALKAGVSFMMVPHSTSTVVTPTLNVNSLGAKNIRRRVSNSTVTTVASSSTNWLYANKPIKVTYDGTYWIADMDRPNAPDIYGTVDIANGGTGASTAAAARENLGITPANIGAATPADIENALANFEGGEITTTVPIAKGGTGATTAAAARTNLGITAANIGALPSNAAVSITNGGTGATTAAAARTNLGITPANIGAQAQHTSTTATLSTSGWSSLAQTVSVSGVTASNTVIVAPAPTSQAAYAKANVRCTAQSSGKLTFTCDTKPTAAITVNVVILT